MILTSNNINSRLDQLSRSAIRKIVKPLFYMRVLSSSSINRLNGRNVREPDVLLRAHPACTRFLGEQKCCAVLEYTSTDLLEGYMTITRKRSGNWI